MNLTSDANLVAMASNRIAMASKLEAMASNLIEQIKVIEEMLPLLPTDHQLPYAIAFHSIATGLTSAVTPGLRAVTLAPTKSAASWNSRVASSAPRDGVQLRADRSQTRSNKRQSFLLLVVRPGAPLVASLLLVAMPFVPRSFLLLVVRPGAPLVASLLVVAMPFVPGSFLAPSSKARSASSSVLAPSSNALSSW